MDPEQTRISSGPRVHLLAHLPSIRRVQHGNLGSFTHARTAWRHLPIFSFTLNWSSAEHLATVRDSKYVSTEMEISLLGKQLGDLEATLERWRDHMAWQEELAAYEADLESLARRLYALEKKVARDRNGEAVTIHFLREFPQTIQQFQTGEPAAVAA